MRGKFLLIICIVLIYGAGIAQNKKASVIPNESEAEYPIPYLIPKPAEIKEVIDRVKNYFVESTPYRIIDSKTGETITDFSEPNQNAQIDLSKGELTQWSYTMGVVYSGMNLATEVTGDKSYLDYAIKNYNFVFDHLPYFRKIDKKFRARKEQFGQMMHMAALDHCGSIGAALIKTYGKNPDQRYRDMIDTVANYITNKQFRLEDGTLARERPQAVSLWTDDFYMSIPFLAQMGKLTGDKKYWDDAVKQVLQMSKYLFDTNKNLYDHGWNARESKYDPKFYWSRANGWAMMAMAELLSVLPENYKGRDKVVDYLNLVTQQLANLQDGTGFWYQMLDKEKTYLETSGTAMFVFAITRGINEGWIDYTYAPVAIAGWNAVATTVLPNGQVEGTCIGTTFANDNVYYFNRPTSVYAMHGYGPVILAGAEMIRLMNNPKYDVNFNKTIMYRLKGEIKRGE
ncbi:MAG TPA: glycoside hydrolase family 88 protein [Melioribacteraceae bacterium]|nr:glycoside hydrolase family 88 protein [Melioribacteraceae bacterium]